MEYTLVKFDHENKMVYNNLKAKEMLDVLTQEELKNPRWVTAIYKLILIRNNTIPEIVTVIPHMLSVLEIIW